MMDQIYNYELKDMKNQLTKPLTEEERHYKAKAREFRETRRKQLEQKLSSNRTQSDIISTRKNNWVCLFALIGFVLQIVLLIIDFDYETYELLDTPICTLIKIMISLSTLILILLIINYYYFLSIIEDTKWGFPTIWAGFFNTTLMYKAIGEILICSMHSPPFLPVKYDLIGLLIFIRVFLLLRFLKYNSKIFRQRHRILKDKQYIRRRRPIFGWRLVMKMYFNTYPIPTLFLVYLSLLLTAAFCIHVSEREVNLKLKSYGNSIYFALVSCASVGYGDITPITYLGKLIVCVFAIFGIITLSLFVSVGDRALRMRTVEQYSVDYVNYLILQLKTYNMSATYIQKYWKLKKLMKEHGLNWPYKASEAKKLNIYLQSVVGILVSNLKHCSRSMHRYRIRSLAKADMIKEQEKKEEINQEVNNKISIAKRERNIVDKQTEEKIRQRTYINIIKKINNIG